MVDESLSEYKTEILQAIAEVHERVREYNERVREKMKNEYDKANKVKDKRYPKVGERVYVWSPNEKAMKTHPKGAVLLSPADKGHLQFQCVDDCFAKTTLSDIQGIQFPGAYGRQPFGDPWTAWKTASIFIRKELTTMQKVELVRNRAVSLDTEALRKVLTVAYSVCTEWTEFICTTRSIAKHESIDQNCVIDFYRIAFEDLKKELQKDEREARSWRKGPTGFAAPEEALLMERDGSKGGLTTKVVSTYKQLRNTLEDLIDLSIWKYSRDRRP
ncbi:hypothetical protein V3C99_017056 [Haemonchus contortus]|uniref:DHC_N1 domain-containing protein n=1 Tax=Haemonchus contortus TaxID=6289 RepID=A0A7I4Z295_HAECO